LERFSELSLVVPGSIFGPSTRVIDAVQRRLPAKWRYPADLEGLEFIRRDTRIDDSATRKDLALEPIPLKKSIADTITWLAESGRVPRRYLNWLLLATSWMFGCGC
jgi:hypothetical protein